MNGSRRLGVAGAVAIAGALGGMLFGAERVRAAADHCGWECVVIGNPIESSCSYAELDEMTECKSNLNSCWIEECVIDEI